MTGELERRYLMLTHDAYQRGCGVPGLVALRHICNSMKGSNKDTELYELKHIMDLQITNGDIGLFQASWIMMLQGMRISLTEPQTEKIYYDAIKRFKPIERDIEHYERLEEFPNHQDRCYEYLFAVVERLSLIHI